MFDFVKINLSDKRIVESLLKNKLLSFNGSFDNETGEVRSKYFAEYQKLKFTVFKSGRVEIAGSIHYYWNYGQHNYNDFKISDVREVFNDLNIKFNINPSVATVHNIEIGLNLITPFNPNEFLDSTIAYKGISFNRMKVVGKGKGIEVYTKSKQYGIKIYNKGLQNSDLTKTNILRFERKILKMESLRKGKIFMIDLLDEDFIELCLNQLYESYSNLIVDDVIDEELLTKPQIKILTEGRNPRSWESFNKKKRSDLKYKFSELIHRFGKLNHYQIIKGLLHKKGYELTGNKNEKKLRIDYLYTVSNSPKKKYCLSCGKDISNQNKNSKFCSERFVGYEAAHKCRNMASNPKNNLEWKLKRIDAKGVLFDVRPFLKQELILRLT